MRMHQQGALPPSLAAGETTPTKGTSPFGIPLQLHSFECSWGEYEIFWFLLPMTLIIYDLFQKSITQT